MMDPCGTLNVFYPSRGLNVALKGMSPDMSISTLLSTSFPHFWPISSPHPNLIHHLILDRGSDRK